MNKTFEMNAKILHSTDYFWLICYYHANIYQHIWHFPQNDGWSAFH